MALHHVTRLRTRLVALAVVPLAVVGVFASMSVSEHSRTATNASRVAPQARELADFVNLNIALADEHGAVSAVAEAEAMGLGVSTVSKLLGYDIIAERTARRTRVDVVLNTLQRDATTARDRALVHTMRTQLALTRLQTKPAEIRVAYVSVNDETNAAIKRLLLGAQRDAAKTASSGRLVALASLEERAIAALSPAADAPGDLVQVLGESLASIAHFADPPIVMLIRHREQFEDNSAWLEEQLPADLRLKWEAAQRTPAARRFNGAVDEAISSYGKGKTASVPVAKIGRLYRDSLQWENDVRAVVDDLSHVVVRESTRIRDRAQLEARIALTLVFSTAFVTLAGMVLLARSMTRPLRTLERRAHQIREGALEGERKASRGPREVRVVSQAFEELVSNLQTVRDQAEALARGRLEDPCLDTHVDGRLGAALQTTVSRLARSFSDGEALRSALSYQATHDALTGLPNRSAVIRALSELLGRAAGGDELTVLFVDLDDFKTANDTYGHHAGDLMLQAVAERLATVLRDGDVAGRLGGDEFIVIAQGIPNARDAIELGTRVVEALSYPVPYEHGQLLPLRATVGIARSTTEHRQPEELLREADAALYHGKANGRGHAVLYDHTMTRRRARRIA